MMNRMIILDRDGVINADSNDYIKSADEWVPLPGSLKAISRLKQAGYLVTVASNQSGLSRGLFSEKELCAIDAKFTTELSRENAVIDGIFYCPHVPGDDCQCRKPNPGLLLQIAAAFAIELTETPFVGDNISDIRAAQAIRAKPVLLRSGKGQAITQQYPEETARVPIYDDLADFVDEILQEH